jgi:hypothetical protein
VHFGPFSFRFDRGELRREDEVVRITEREREILTILGAQAGDNVPREALSGNGAAANERTVDVQINRLRRKIETDPANPIFLQTCARHRLSARRRAMRFARLLVGRPGRAYQRFARWFSGLMPKGLYARSLIIIIAPMVLLQSVIAYAFMERHWQTVTRRLSSAVTADIAALIDVYESYPQEGGTETLERIAAERLGLDVEILRGTDLPPPAPRPFFSILDEALSEELQRQISRPFWTDTVGRSNLIEIRIGLDGDVMRVIARRSQAYASNSHIFLVWMGGSSMVLLGVAILFLRNQIRPSCGSRTPPRASARAATWSSVPAAPGRSGRRAMPSSR